MPYLLQALILVLLLALTVALFILVWRQKSLQQLYELNPLPLFRLNRALRLEGCNSSFARLLGYRNSRECLVLYNAYPHDLGVNAALLDALTCLTTASSERSSDVTLMNRFGDAVVRRIALVQCLPRGRIDLCVLVQARDASAAGEFEHLLQQSLLPALLLDKNLRIDALNSPARALFGVAVGESLEALFAAEDRQRVTALIERRMAGRSAAALSFAGLLKHQETRDCEWYFVRGSYGNTMLALCEVASRPSLLAPVLDRVIQGPWGFWTLDLAQQTLQLSDSWRELLGGEGAAASEALGWWREIVAPQDQQRVFDAMTRYLQTPALGFCLRHQMAGPNGVLHWVNSQAIQIDRTASGEILRVIGMHRLSETHESGIAIDSARYGEADLLPPFDMRAFKHDALDQMAVVEGHLGLLRHNRSIPDSVYQSVLAMGQATANLRELLRATLTKAGDLRAERGENSGTVASGVQACVWDTVDAARRPDSGLHWLLRWVENYQIHDARPWHLVHDTAHDMVNSTADNVIHDVSHEKAYARSAVTTAASDLPTECCVCGLTITPGPWCRIEWRQAGPLMAQQCLQYLQYLFDERLPEARRAAQSQSGVIADDLRVLPALAEMIHEQGGHLQLQATAQESRLSVFLPLLSAAHVVARATDGHGGKGRVATKSGDQTPLWQGAKRIMVVDDQPAVSSYLNILLSEAGYQVSVFNNPREALTILRRSPASTDLIITDQQMPDLSGDAIIQAMGQLRPDLPIILCSGYGDDEWSRSGRPIESISKPVDPDALFASLKRLLLPAE
ncbi:MAG: CheY-like chemotaxis protein/PAS domain-containing protein [Candidatus Pseudothioglobus sp.]|jgi:CheY-like chemotaxis protein/PAS domain-containing protein